jgi:hypothetical protein
MSENIVVATRPPTHELHSQLTSTTVDVERALDMPTSHSSSLSAIDFDRSEWEIMYPLFVAEGLVDPFEHVDRGSS